MGMLDPERGQAKYNIEFEFTVAPPSLRLSVYLMCEYRSRTSHPQRFDVKAIEEDLESRRDCAPADKSHFMGGLFPSHRYLSVGGNFEIKLTCGWNPCFAVLRWQYKDFHMAVDVRPSPPYRDWVRGGLSTVDLDGGRDSRKPTARHISRFVFPGCCQFSN